MRMMRRHIVLAAMTGILLFPWRTGRAADADSFDARITKLDGDATVYYRDQGDKGVSAEEGMPLDPGDRVVTGDESRVEIGIEGDSAIELGPKSEFTVASLDRKASVFTLKIGSLLAKVQSLFANGGQMDIRTPTAVASVRGTEFGVEEAADGGHVGVFDEGKVAVTGASGGQEVLLKPNQETSVEGGHPPSAPVALDRFAGRRERMRFVIQRARALRANWRRMTPQQRRALRSRIFRRRLAIMRAIREKRQELKHERHEQRERERRER